jgi:hypothetical protein
MVKNTPRKPYPAGIDEYTSDAITTGVNELTAPCNHPVIVEQIKIRKIYTDARTQFTSSNFGEA